MTDDTTTTTDESTTDETTTDIDEAMPASHPIRCPACEMDVRATVEQSGMDEGRLLPGLACACARITLSELPDAADVEAIEATLPAPWEIATDTDTGLAEARHVLPPRLGL